MLVIAATSTNLNPVEMVMIFAAILLLGITLAWDGLVRRHVLLPSSPFGLGYVAVSGLWAALIGVVATLLDLFLIFCVFIATLQALETCRYSLACIGGKARAVEWVTWVGLAGCVTWFVFIWLYLGTPDKRVLVYGVWYRQEKVARLVQRELQAKGLKPLPIERIYALETTLVQMMHQQHWLVDGKRWLDGGNYPAKDISVAEMLEVVLQQPPYQQSGKSQRAAIAFLLGYFKTEAERARRMSPLHRWLVGSAQLGKIQVYGRHAA